MIVCDRRGPNAQTHLWKRMCVGPRQIGGGWWSAFEWWIMRGETHPKTAVETSHAGHGSSVRRDVWATGRVVDLGVGRTVGLPVVMAGRRLG